MNKLKLLLSVSRPMFWISGVLAFLTGLFYSGGNLSLLGMLQIILLTLPAGVITFGINDVYDYNSDKINPRKKHIEGIKLKPKYHKFILKSALFFSIIFIMGSILTFNITNILASLLLLLSVYLYSAPPIRLKQRPPLDSITNGIIVLSVFLIGFSYGKSFYSIDKQILFATFCVSGFHMFTTIMDLEYDKKAGDITFAVKFGKRSAAFFPLIIYTSALLFGDFSKIIESFLVFCSVLFLTSVIYPRERIAKVFTKFIYVALIITGIVYLLQFF